MRGWKHNEEYQLCTRCHSHRPPGLLRDGECVDGWCHRQLTQRILLGPPPARLGEFNVDVAARISLAAHLLSAQNQRSCTRTFSQVP